MSNVAAPLLAGFSVSTIGIVLTGEPSLRWPGFILVSLTVASVAFIMCVQFGFHARQHLYSPADVSSWWSEEDVRAHTADLESEQRRDFARWALWTVWARRFYSTGIVALWFGVGSALCPTPDDHGSTGLLRWVAASIALGAGLGELCWSVVPAWRRRRRRARILDGQRP
ncbi:hypothetical protein ACFXKJ_21770 [Kitasatospora indigofera]|uniref:hypothetical protein n=1 Tax=Kitasatospora indigofera TaxID=67307 RepID=UPI0036AF3078